MKEEEDELTPRGNGTKSTQGNIQTKPGLKRGERREE